jgi:hypothetical protein
MEFTFPMREEDCGKSHGMVAAKRSALSGLIRPCKASTFRFKDDRSFPTIRCHLSRRFRTQVQCSRAATRCSHFDRQLVYQKRFNQDGTLGNETRHKACA